jgi:hypothetical protein
MANGEIEKLKGFVKDVEKSAPVYLKANPKLEEHTIS